MSGTAPARARRRAPLAALAVVALVAGMWGGLARLGWLPPGTAWIPATHGPLIVLGFLGTLIGLERAVAIRKTWAYGAPLASGSATLAIVLAGSTRAGAILATLGGASLTAIFVVIFRMQPKVHNAVLLTGALAGVAAGALWAAGRSTFQIALLLVAFPVLTIAGERLELARLASLSRAGRAMLLTACGVFLVGSAWAAAAPGPGGRLAGAGLVALGAWLARYDVARRTIRRAGLPRFTAICLLAGYAWLAVAGALALLGGLASSGLRHDATLHAITLGFVMSMIFGHAPIILPAVFGGPIRFRRSAYAHVTLLHGSLAARVTGDLAPAWELRRWGALLNVIAILAFLANTAAGALGARRAGRARGAGRAPGAG